MATDLMHRPPHLSGWAETDDGCPRVPEAPPPRWPLAVEVLASAQARRASRILQINEPAPRTA